MVPFQAPVDDILFAIRHVSGAPELEGWDDELAEGIITHFASLAEGVIAPVDEIGDAKGCRLVDGRVQVPDEFHDVFAQIVEGGWQGLTAPEAHGGMEVNHIVSAAVSEIFTGACHSLQMICNLVPGAISTLMNFGSAAQQEAWIPRMIAGEVLSTMCLTEPGAGSDLSRIRTKALRDGDDWVINGEKIFISGGDQNLSKEVLHLVLARTGAPEDGVKGLSLFLCPSHLEDARNTVSVTRIEEKLGIHASPTCQMAFDNARAQLIGQEGAGLMAMFTMMNHARLDVSLQGVAHASRAAHIASAYAAERSQGRQADGSPATIDQHYDVRRMLDEQRALALGARTMCLLTMVEMEKNGSSPLVDFLTPICKIFCTDAGIRAADLGIQVLGGYGFLTEYRVSQTWRDARITSIYEGTNGIHALTTATRGLKFQGGAGADAFAALIAEMAAGQDGVLAQLERWTSARATVAQSDKAAELAQEFADMTADLFYKAAWCRILSVANKAGEAQKEIERLGATVLNRASRLN
ncbi:MAG: acyl-CoA dehydrogenase family protein [Mangrovicoccus sp.]